ncbi:MAG: 2OG-Fe(II) oxygenase [Brevundimonas sp.]|nr:2OG-Fe(II) oxygenase [Brevundimonas sp.]
MRTGLERGEAGARAPESELSIVESISLGEAGRWAIADSYSAGHAFFVRPEAEKRTCTGPHGCGFRPYGVEHSGEPDQPDRIESFTVSRRFAKFGRELTCPAGRRLHKALLHLFDVLESVADDLMRSWAAEIAGRERAEALRGGLAAWSLVQMNCSLSTGLQEFINSDHDDGTLLTLCNADGPGLEIEQDGGEFRARPPIADQMTVLPGAVAWLLSGGLVKPRRHRVRGGVAGRRQSLLFFADLEPALCEPWSVSPINAGVDIGSRVLTSPGEFGLPPLPPGGSAR